MGRLKIEYGIDLGTTNSGIARMESGISNMLEIDKAKQFLLQSIMTEETIPKLVLQQFLLIHILNLKEIWEEKH